MVPTPRAADVEALIPLTGKPVPLVRVTADGVPRLGVVKVGLVVKARTPVPIHR